MIAGNFGVESFGEFCEFVFDEDLLSLLKELKSSSMELTMMETYEKEITSFFYRGSDLVKGSFATSPTPQKGSEMTQMSYKIWAFCDELLAHFLNI